MLGEMIKRHVRLEPNQVKEFVDAATKCDFDVDIYYNRYVVDAKSILGVFNLDLTQPLTVEYRGYNQGFEQFLNGIALAG
jgi:phosphotransferase system HPr-like phosphotransfer protein